MAINPEELDALSGEVAGFMMDRCQVLSWQSGAQNALGIPTQAYRAGAEQPCTFRSTSQRETQGTAQAVAPSATLKLPLSVTVTARDRIRLTARYGRALGEPAIYAITNLQRGMVQWSMELTAPTDPTVEVP